MVACGFLTALAQTLPLNRTGKRSLTLVCGCLTVLAVLRPLLKQKVRSIRAENDYERTQKLVRFALGRGFTFDIIRQCLNVDDDMNTEDDED